MFVPDRSLQPNQMFIGRARAFPREAPLVVKAGSAITNGREPRSCLGRVFNSKLGCFATLGSKCMMVCMQPLLKLKTRPKAHPVS
jgi:hypothetical protein